MKKSMSPESVPDSYAKGQSVGRDNRLGNVGDVNLLGDVWNADGDGNVLGDGDRDRVRHVDRDIVGHVDRHVVGDRNSVGPATKQPIRKRG